MTATRRRKALCPDCGVGWDGRNICHCAVCHMTFTAVGGFDAHRTGPDEHRQCRTPDEMIDLGYEPNAYNQWRKPAPADHKWPTSI